MTTPEPIPALAGKTILRAFYIESDNLSADPRVFMEFTDGTTFEVQETSQSGSISYGLTP